MRKPFWVLAAFTVLVGCSDMKVDDFADTQPAFVPEEYFAGKLRAWGLFQDRFGVVRRQFVVDIDGTWDGTTLTLVEDFVYTDGEIEQRVWEITKLDDDSYEGRADDVIGVAKGQIAGQAMNWNYIYDLKVGDGSWHVRFDDWMLLQGDGVMINRATVSKLGVTLGEVSLFFRKLSDAVQLDAEPAHAMHKGTVGSSSSRFAGIGLPQATQ
ncbi:MAG: DUF3833 domain-containing protein [Geminicoccaceae bacterium]